MSSCPLIICVTAACTAFLFRTFELTFLCLPNQLFGTDLDRGCSPILDLRLSAHRRQSICCNLDVELEIFEQVDCFCAGWQKSRLSIFKSIFYCDYRSVSSSKLSHVVSEMMILESLKICHVQSIFDFCFGLAIINRRHCVREIKCKSRASDVIFSFSKRDATSNRLENLFAYLHCHCFIAAFNDSIVNDIHRQPIRAWNIVLHCTLRQNAKNVRTISTR